MTEKRSPDYPATAVTVDLLDEGCVMVHKIRDGEPILSVEVRVHNNFMTVTTPDRMIRRDANLSQDQYFIVKK